MRGDRDASVRLIDASWRHVHQRIGFTALAHAVRAGARHGIDVPDARFTAPLHRWLYDRLRPGEPARVCVEGCILDVDAARTGVATKLLTGRLYEPHVVRALDCVRPGSTVVDVGAHIGYFTALASARTGAGGRIFAIEPDPSNVRYLRLNAARCEADVIVIAAAAGRRAGRDTLWTDARSSTRGALRRDNVRAPTDSISVDVVTVDDVLGDARVDLIKVDAQGAEGLVLEGARTTIGEHRPMILLELWPVGMRGFGCSASDLLDELHGFGYRARILGAGRPAAIDPRLALEVALSKRADGRGHVDLLLECRADG